MEDLIRRSDAIKGAKRLHNLFSSPFYNRDRVEMIEACFNDIPSADRPQGEWVLISEVASNLGHKCSNCGEKAKMIVVRSVLVDNYYCNKAEPITEYTHKEQLSKFCPNCGARMKGADDE